MQLTVSTRYHAVKQASTTRRRKKCFNALVACEDSPGEAQDATAFNPQIGKMGVAAKDDPAGSGYGETRRAYYEGGPKVVFTAPVKELTAHMLSYSIRIEAGWSGLFSGD